MMSVRRRVKGLRALGRGFIFCFFGGGFCLLLFLFGFFLVKGEGGMWENVVGFFGLLSIFLGLCFEGGGEIEKKGMKLGKEEKKFKRWRVRRFFTRSLIKMFIF